MKIEPSVHEDIPSILELYRSAADYQRHNGYNVWHEFAPELIANEIAHHRHFKITEGNAIACVFTICYSDPVIWEEKDKDPAVYLHRIATNPAFKGQGMMRLIQKWAAQHALDNKKKFIRMDTWGDNENLKAYYEKCGFDFAGRRVLPDPNPLPAHYWGISLCLFEINVGLFFRDS